MDVALLIFLILLNALFAMSEMALTASRKARLQVMVEAGDGGAQAAMDLHDNPTKFLSVVQIGITAIGNARPSPRHSTHARPMKINASSSGDSTGGIVGLPGSGGNAHSIFTLRRRGNSCRRTHAAAQRGARV